MKRKVISIFHFDKCTTLTVSICISLLQWAGKDRQRQNKFSSIISSRCLGQHFGVESRERQPDCRLAPVYYVVRCRPFFISLAGIWFLFSLLVLSMSFSLCLSCPLVVPPLSLCLIPSFFHCFYLLRHTCISM